VGIAPGADECEAGTIKDFGSFIFVDPLRYAHPSGTQIFAQALDRDGIPVVIEKLDIIPGGTKHTAQYGKGFDDQQFQNGEQSPFGTHGQLADGNWELYAPELKTTDRSEHSGGRNWCAAVDEDKTCWFGTENEMEDWFGPGTPMGRGLGVEVSDPKYEQVAFQLEVECDPGKQGKLWLHSKAKGGQLRTIINGKRQMCTTVQYDNGSGRDGPALALAPATGMGLRLAPAQACRDGWECECKCAIDPATVDVDDTTPLQVCEYVFNDGGKKTIRLEFWPMGSTQTEDIPRARVRVKMQNVKKSFGDCVLFHESGHVGMCAENMGGDNDLDGLNLRSSTELQQQCIKNSSLAALESYANNTATDERNDACKAFADCLQVEGQSAIAAMIAASTPGPVVSPVQPPMLMEETHRNQLKTEDAEEDTTCVDPRYADPESWGCDCYATWSAKCNVSSFVYYQGLSQTDLAVCMKLIFCSHSAVCQEWKDAVNNASTDAGLVPQCGISLMQRSGEGHDQGHSLAERSTNRLEDIKHTDSGTSLDETLADKCVS